LTTKWAKKLFHSALNFMSHVNVRAKNANISAHVTSSSELLAEKSGLGGCELEDRCEGGHGSSSSSVPDV
jgi:hypothetical protein